MAKNKSDLLALINTNLADNTTKAITPTKLREVETQMTDSNLNTLESTAQTVAGLVNFTGGLQKAGSSVLVGAQEKDIMRAYSMASIQQPTALGSAIQVEFGAAQSTPEVSLSAAGVLTCNVSGTYALRIKLQFGRSGATGVSYLMSRIVKNATQFGVSQCTRISPPDSIIPTDSRVIIPLLAGDTITVQVIRDSLGANAGGLFAQASSHGWILAPTALLDVAKVEGVA